MSNVVIKKRVAAYNVDSYNRTAVCESTIDNGCIFKLASYSETDGEGIVWKAEQAAEADTGLWMATSPEVVTVTDAMGVEYRGLNVDPRAFTNIAGKMIDATKLVEGDIIEMTGDGITGIDTNEYLVPDTTGFKLKAQGSAGSGFCLHKIGTSILHVGGAMIAKSHPVTYKYEVVKN